MKVPFIDLGKEYDSIKEEVDKSILDTLKNSAFILGKEVAKFEKEFADFCGAKFAIGLNSGTSALHLALLANRVGRGDEVLTVPNTFIATVEAIFYTGAKPVFVDIDPKTYNIDVNLIEKAITDKTKAIIPVHLYGQPADMKPIIEIAQKHNLSIIEDCCQAHGAEYNGKRVPVSGIGCFSFYPTKNLGAFGEGGAVVTNNEAIAEKIKLLRNHGQKQKNIHSVIGFNNRLEGIHGAVLRVKFRNLDKWNNSRRRNAQLYNGLLKNSKVIIPYEAGYAKHVYHLYVIRSKERDKLQEYLKAKGISTDLHYPTPIHLQEACFGLGYKSGDFPITEKSAKQIISLPVIPELTAQQIEYVADTIKKCSFL